MDGRINERSRSAATADDDASDQIGYDTPRSGVATPQPDLHDKRTPGIMSYFNQVRPASFQRLLSGNPSSSGQAAAAPSSPHYEEPRHTACPSFLPHTQITQMDPAPSSSGSSHSSPLLLPQEKMDARARESQSGGASLHPYPTPPTSQPPSLRHAKMSNASTDSDTGGASLVTLRPSLPEKRHSDVMLALRSRSSSSCVPVTGITPCSVHARHFSSPSGGNAATAPSSPTRSPLTPADDQDASPSQPASLGPLKKLTSLVGLKSGQSTPTRSLSTAHPPPQAEPQDDTAAKEPQNGIDRAAAHTPTPPAGAQAPAPKGKLTIKINEARGLRKSRDPYVVVVFQRSELISAGPHPVEENDESAVASAAMGGIAIQRQSSDSGRPPMAIPMRSRQSSNTSITDYNTFRSRGARRSFTNPKWDAEAVL